MEKKQSIPARLKAAGIKMVKKADEAYLEYRGKIVPLPPPKCYVTVCKIQFGIMI